MIIPDRKKTAGVIVSRMGEDGSEKSASMNSEESMGDSAHLHSIAQSILMAIKNDSSMDLMKALRDFCDSCDSDEDEE